MVGKIKVNFSGEEVDASPIEVTQSTEHWNQYLLDDGSVIKIKTVLTKVLRVDHKYDNEGNPLYITQTTNIVSADAPDNLRKK